MLYYIFELLENQYQFPGASVFQYISFRASIAIILSMGFSLIFGKKIINFLRNQQIGESIRDLGLEGQKEKEGTPTMGGIIILLSTLIPVFLLARLDNIYILLLLITMVWMGLIGWIDDYIKIFKKNKDGLKGKFKVIGQVRLGIFIGSVLYFNERVTVRINVSLPNGIENGIGDQDISATLTTIPLLKNNEFDYHSLIGWMGFKSESYTWLILFPL